MATIPQSELQQQQLEDLRWARRAPEVQEHAGKLVAIHRKRVVGVGMDRNALVAQAAEKAKCGWQEIVVYVVQAGDLSEIPH